MRDKAKSREKLVSELKLKKIYLNVEMCEKS